MITKTCLFKDSKLLCIHWADLPHTFEKVAFLLSLKNHLKLDCYNFYISLGIERIIN